MNNLNYNNNFYIYFKRFTHDTVLYGIGNLFHKLSSLAIYFIIVRNLSIENFGIFDFYMTLINFAIICIAFGQDSSLARLLYDSKDSEYKREIISQSLYLQLFFLIITIVVGYLVLDIFKINYINFILVNNIIFFLIPFFFFINFCLNVFKWNFRRNSYLIVTLGSSFLLFFSILIISNIIILNIKFILLTYLFVYIFFSILSFILITDLLKFSSNFKYLKDLLSFAYPYGIISLIMIGVALIERSIIIKFIDIKSLGIYALATKISLIVYLFTNTFHMAWGPSSYLIYNNSYFKIYYKLIFKIYILFSILLLILISNLSHFIVEFFGGEEFIFASNLIFPISLSIIIYSCSEISGIGINLKKKPIYSLISYILYLIIFILFAFLSIHKYGITGLAWSLVFASIALLFIESYISQKLLKIDFEFVFSSILATFFVIALIFMYTLNYKQYFFTNNYFILILNIFLLFVSTIIYLNKSEKNIIKNFFNK